MLRSFVCDVCLFVKKVIMNCLYLSQASCRALSHGVVYQWCAVFLIVIDSWSQQVTDYPLGPLPSCVRAISLRASFPDDILTNLLLSPIWIWTSMHCNQLVATKAICEWHVLIECKWYCISVCKQWHCHVWSFDAVLFPRHTCPEARDNTINLIHTLRDYVHYHIKCSKVSKNVGLITVNHFSCYHV